MKCLALKIALILQLLLVADFTLAATYAAQPIPPPLPPGTPAPHFVTKTLDGKPYDSNSMIGHITVLDFWATWCTECKASMPDLQKISKSYAAKGVQVIGMSGDSYSIDQVRPLIKKLHITYQIMADPHHNFRIEDSYNAEPLPSTFVVDRKGIVRWSVTGDLDPAVLRKVLDTVLKSQ